MIHYLPDGRAYCDCGCEFCMMNPNRLDPYVQFDEVARALQTLDEFLLDCTPIVIRPLIPEVDA
jgi:hypothetical protein